MPAALMFFFFFLALLFNDNPIWKPVIKKYTKAWAESSATIMEIWPSDQYHCIFSPSNINESQLFTVDSGSKQKEK